VTENVLLYNGFNIWGARDEWKEEGRKGVDEERKK